MNKVQNARRSRGRGQKRNKANNGAGRGDGRVKGNPKQLIEKYKSLARDAQQAGDRVLAEYYLQHADHYQRIWNERYGAPEPAEDETSAPAPRRSRSQRAAAAAKDVANGTPGDPESGQPSTRQSDGSATDGAGPVSATATEADGKADQPDVPAAKPRRRRRAPEAASAPDSLPVAEPSGE
ncbi:MAG: DUF4167 domain-containing protein [Alphaproteobacteria bacterium]|nr:MAG: DUF4167 domain-containing protein [Alphaproteobacteria bacterium]